MACDYFLGAPLAHFPETISPDNALALIESGANLRGWSTMRKYGAISGRRSPVARLKFGHGWLGLSPRKANRILFPPGSFIFFLDDSTVTKTELICAKI